MTNGTQPNHYDLIFSLLIYPDTHTHKLHKSRFSLKVPFILVKTFPKLVFTNGA